MSVIQLTLHDFDRVNNKPKPVITIEVNCDPNMSLEQQGFKKISITAGDDIGCGTVTLPLAALTQAMAALMKEDAKRSSAILTPGSGIVRPH